MRSGCFVAEALWSKGNSLLQPNTARFLLQTAQREPPNRNILKDG